MTGFRNQVRDRIAGYAKVFGDYVGSVGWMLVDQSDIVHTKEIDGIAASKPCCTWVGWSWLERSGAAGVGCEDALRTVKAKEQEQPEETDGHTAPLSLLLKSDSVQLQVRKWKEVQGTRGQDVLSLESPFLQLQFGLLKKGCARDCAIKDVVSKKNGRVRYNERYKIMGLLPEVLDKLVANLKSKKIVLPPFKVPKQKTKWTMGKTARAALGKYLTTLNWGWGVRRRR
eukprot:CAMPEP_0204525176 /NCGR_PEP_ID=MMETSP0661-20131031/7770_1 /ASSEMBLY_ACC=CAM_ASM_000606 /TAXON_ID=109239 /ORGANISM="Alexandrium margalefi, Strain AMGDE01CS-322" /LENGTH=227 /DNA_ID=CAMNT_0051530961 /DNA_START=62 /DNA_END=745 /DNA_ORIENTATION=+